MSSVPSSNERYIEPTIIGVADSANYLVGALDSENNFIGLLESKKIIVLGSLSAAKQYLRSNNISSATLEFQTAYDEMCGVDCNSQYRQIINL